MGRKKQADDLPQPTEPIEEVPIEQAKIAADNVEVILREKLPTVTLTLPIGPLTGEHHQRHIESRLNRRQAEALKRLLNGLQHYHHPGVQKGAHVIVHLFDQLADAIQDARL